MRTSPVVDRATIVGWLEVSYAALGQAREMIDSLNVFPVPDGDTGTNMYLTMQSAVEAARNSGPEVVDSVRAMAQGALLGARGNSGVILSQILRGVADAVEAACPEPVWSDELIADGLERAADHAYASVAHPVEGTILTVARSAARNAREAVGSGPVAVVEAAADGSAETLALTPTMLPALAAAGVVDSGGRGLVVILDALVDVVTGTTRLPRTEPVPVIGDPADGHVAVTPAGCTYTGPAYEVMFLLNAPQENVDVLRAVLDGMGDSLVVVGSMDVWNVHVHVDDAGGAVEAAMAQGRPFNIRITHLGASPKSGGRAIVVVAHGPGIAQACQSAGASVVMAGRVPPSTKDILDAIMATNAEQVIVLPSDKATQFAASAAGREAERRGRRVVVIPTRSIVQSLAAIAVHDANHTLEEDVVGMSRSAGATRYGAITIAVRAAMTSGGPCMPGDILGVVDGDIVEVGNDYSAVTQAVLQRLLSTGGELVTLITGEEHPAAIVADALQWLRKHHLGVDTDVIDGGQDLWPLIIGVE